MREITTHFNEVFDQCIKAKDAELQANSAAQRAESEARRAQAGAEEMQATTARICDGPVVQRLPPPTDVTVDVFSVNIGNCVLDGSYCVTSPDFPLSHVNSDREFCSITVNVNATGYLSATAFSAGLNSELSVDGTVYSGTTGPLNQLVTGGALVSWSSDYLTSQRGWRLCFYAADNHLDYALRSAVGDNKVERQSHSQRTIDRHRAPTSVPTPPAFIRRRHGSTTQTGRRTASDVFSIISGSCLLETNDACATTPNFPSKYGSGEDCSITVNADGFLSATVFATESGYDKLTVEGTVYSGSIGPSNQAVPSGATVQWESDSSEQSQGWRLCYSAEAVFSFAPTTTAPTSRWIELNPACNVHVSSTSGSDSDTCGLSSSSACETIQQGINRAGTYNTVCVHAGGWPSNCKVV